MGSSAAIATGVGRAWIMAAGASGSKPSADRSEHQKEPLDSRGFFVAVAVPMTGEYPAGLLDIGGSLC